MYKYFYISQEEMSTMNSYNSQDSYSPPGKRRYIGVSFAHCRHFILHSSHYIFHISHYMNFTSHISHYTYFTSHILHYTYFTSHISHLLSQIIDISHLTCHIIHQTTNITQIQLNRNRSKWILYYMIMTPHLGWRLSKGWWQGTEGWEWRGQSST